ncbi:hypothetical protein OH77DRAFT_1592278 [Trametes cingulata]|nr:hypothetical protein OH77DRAFT_1592278 [Trametes cingulata]
MTTSITPTTVVLRADLQDALLTASTPVFTIPHSAVAQFPRIGDYLQLQVVSEPPFSEAAHRSSFSKALVNLDVAGPVVGFRVVEGKRAVEYMLKNQIEGAALKYVYLRVPTTHVPDPHVDIGAELVRRLQALAETMADDEHEHDACDDNADPNAARTSSSSSELTVPSQLYSPSPLFPTGGGRSTQSSHTLQDRAPLAILSERAQYPIRALSTEAEIEDSDGRSCGGSLSTMRWNHPHVIALHPRQPYAPLRPSPLSTVAAIAESEEETKGVAHEV